MRRFRFLRASAAAALALLPGPWPAHAQFGATWPVFDLAGSAPFERLGHAVAAVGDLNGDGRPDFAIGAPGWGPSASDSTGRVLVFLGGRRVRWEPDLVLTGAGPRQLFGFAIAGVGDANGDGFDDLVVTAPGHSYPDPQRQGSGRAYLFFGGPILDATPDVVFDAPPVVSTNGVQFFGGSVAGLGDASRDGFPDWSVGFDRSATLAYGGAVTYLGGRTIATQPATYSGSIGSGRPVLCGPGDMNGDGRADLAIGSPGILRNNQAYVSVHLGVGGSGSAMYDWFSSSTTEGYGAALAAAGDLNRDGCADLWIGHPKPAGGGAASLWWGTPGLSFPNVSSVFAGTRPDSFGCALSVGRADGTGNRTLIVGASGDDAAGPAAGSVTVFSLGSSLVVTQIRSVPGDPASALGFRATFVGDVDGNGEDDFLMASPFAPGPGPAAGRVRLVTLSPHTLLDPAGPAEWFAGETAEVRWLGSTSARLSLSLDDGATWRTLAESAGGAADNRRAVAVPDSVTARALVRISTAGSLGDALHSDRSDHSLSIVRRLDPPGGVVREVALHPAGGASGRLGAALSGGADFDGDGFPDGVAGVPYADAAGGNSGELWLLPGGTTPASPRVIPGERTGDHFGAALALGGDANRDGRPDLLVGAPGRGPAGSARLFLDGTGSGPVASFSGSQAGEEYGSTVAWIGDMNGDGFDDFAIAAPEHRSGVAGRGDGRVELFLGRPDPSAAAGIVLWAPVNTRRFGRALAGLDLNGDGYRDLAVSYVTADGRIGAVDVYLGGASPSFGPGLRLRGRAALDRFGEAIASGGDRNGDGAEELLVGAPGAAGSAGAEAGRVHEFLGGARPAPLPYRSLEGLAAGEEFGASLAGLGDVNGDGRDDLAAGAPGASGWAGVVRVYFGGSGPGADAEWRGRQPGERFGAALAPAGDGDGDGRREFLAGAPLHAYPRSSATGRVARLDVPRHAVEEPLPGARWFGGGRYAVRWRGAEPADLDLSLDAGRSWRGLAAGAGGSADNTFEFVAPAVTADSVYLRLRPSRAGVPPGEVLRGPVSIGSEVHVDRYDYEITEAGIRLAWETRPGLGEHGLSAYRLYRERAGVPPERVGPERIEAAAWLVREFERGASYVLAGVHGNGAESELARLTVAGPGSALRVWPVPSTEFGDVEMSVFPPVDAGGRTGPDFAVTVVDVSGRAVRRVTGGTMGTKVGEVRARWDLRRADGARVPAGLYFVRAESPARGFRVERRVVVLK